MSPHRNTIASARQRGRPARRAIVLLLVLVVVTMLALGGFTFARLMMAEARAARYHGLRVKARAAAHSGVDYVVAALADQRRRDWQGAGLWDNESRFRDVLVSGTPSAIGDPAFRFSVVAPRDDPSRSNRFPLRFGVSDEASRLNLNGWPWIVHLLENPDRDVPRAQKNPLMSLPRMRPQVADAILDWIDPDDDPRPAGAESSYYLSLNPPYLPRNAPLQSLHELLMVRGVTPQMLYGEDANQNGLLDANENDGPRTYPNDDADGILDRGWLAFLTLHSRSSDTDRQGRERIFLNASDLQSLYEKLTEDPEIGEDLARFVIAYRLFGPIDQESDQDDLSERANGEDELSSDRPANEQAGQPESNANPGTEESRSTDVTIAGLDASGGPAFDIASALDLIDVSVAAATTSGDGLELPSPLTTAPGGVDLDHWLDRTTTVQGGGSLGPVNVNTAPREVLMAVPQMREEMAASILAGRTRRRVEREPFDAGLAWLLVDGALTVEQLKSLEPYLTGHSQVFRMQVIGYSEDGKAVARVRSIVDLSGSAAMVVSQRDLSSLGHGYSIRSLFGR